MTHHDDFYAHDPDLPVAHRADRYCLSGLRLSHTDATERVTTIPLTGAQVDTPGEVEALERRYRTQGYRVHRIWRADQPTRTGALR